jgi:hypothetical protein
MSDRHLEVVPVSRHHWVVRFEGDPTPLAEEATLTDATAAARNLARRFHGTAIHIHELDGEVRTLDVPPIAWTPEPAEIKPPRADR